jgi:hypothetical protein
MKRLLVVPAVTAALFFVSPAAAFNSGDVPTGPPSLSGGPATDAQVVHCPRFGSGPGAFVENTVGEFGNCPMD